MAPPVTEFLIDCGNSCVKVAHRGPDGPTDPMVLPPEAVAAWWQEHVGVSTLILPTGRSAAVVRSVCGAGARVVGSDLPLPELGQYPGCGADRVLAGLAAVTRHGPCVVVDAGTATTLGAWDRHAGRPRFLGGLICPGVVACALGLSTAAPALEVPDLPTTPLAALQRDTRGALAAALAIGHPAMVQACLTRIRRESGLGLTVITGGDRAVLLACDPLAVEDPLLVLHGMHLLCKEHDL